MKEIFEYRTVKGRSRGVFQSRGSKFTAYLFPATELEDVETMLAGIKSEHFKARHFCYAYRLLNSGFPVEYSSDAGEPSGSAGMPILGALKRSELLNAACIVVRYYGGTKLGIPGLIEAYRTSTEQAISTADIVQHRRTRWLRLSMPIALQPQFLHVAIGLDMQVHNAQYGSSYSADLLLSLDNARDELHELLLKLSDRDYDNTADLLRYLEIEIVDGDL